MKIYLLQHGNQNPKEIDPEEGLSENGKSDVAKIAEFAMKAGLKPSKIFHSVKLRAKQTAEIIKEKLGGELTMLKGLKPMDDVKTWADKIENGLMIVGHLPFMQKFSSLLICGNEETKCVNFNQGGIVCLEKDEEGNWSVNFAIIPELL